jgi:hypothetical protein
VSLQGVPDVFNDFIGTLLRISFSQILLDKAILAAVKIFRVLQDA